MISTINTTINPVNNCSTSNYGFVENTTNISENSSGLTSVFQATGTVSDNSELLYLIKARYVTIFFCIFSFYLFTAALVYELKKKNHHMTKISAFLTTGATFAALFSSFWQLGELWSCCVITCRNLRWIYALCYIINSSFIYTIVWFHQRKLYSDPRLSESKNRYLKVLNITILAAIQVTLILVVGALVISYPLSETNYGCILIWDADSLHQVVVPTTVVSMVASAIFRIALLGLIVYPLLKRITGISFRTAKIIKYKQINKDIKDMILRLALCTFLSLFAKVVIDIVALLEAIGQVDVFISNLRLLELIAYSFFINFTFVNWKQRLFPFVRYN